MKRVDLPLLIVTVILIAIGLAAIYSAGESRHFLRQIFWTPIAFAGLVGAMFIPRRILYGLTEVIYTIILILLVAVVFFGTGPGARRWFNLGAFSFQPSEFAKLATVIMLAKYISYKRSMNKTGGIPQLDFDFSTIAGPALLILLPFTLILLEPDLSTSLCLIPPFAAMLYWQGLRPLHIFLLFMPFISFTAGFSFYLWVPFFIILAIVVFLRMRILRAVLALATGSVFGLLSPIVLSMLKDYQRARLFSFFAPWFDPHGMGWNAIQSQIAIGSGRIFGKGFLHGTQKRLGFLPNRHTDFIFSSIAEETGFIGGLILLALFGILIYRFLTIAYRSRDQQGALICVGFAAIIGYQMFVNIGMLLGLLPVTGIPLPFISYGGSSLVVTTMMVGLALNIALRPE